MHINTSCTLAHVLLFRYQCFTAVSVRRSIKTDSSEKKGKVSVVRKRVFADELRPPEDIEIKVAADFMKRFNWENQHLFGDIITAVKKRCSALGNRKASKKGIARRAGECFNYNPIPIKDVITPPPLDSSGNHVCDVSGILDFPMTDSGKCEPSGDLVYKCNSLRQQLEYLNGPESMPSVTTVLEKTVPPERRLLLERWKSKMIGEMGEEKFHQYQQDMLKQGSMFHHNVSMHLTGTPESELAIDPANYGYWRSVMYAVPCVHDVRILEENVTHPFLHYHGVVDCFGMFRNRFVAVEWKTSRKPKLTLASTYDNPLQLAAYVGALNFDPKFNYTVSKGLLVIAYESGSAATMHFMEEDVLLMYWKQWLERLKCYWENVAVKRV